MSGGYPTDLSCSPEKASTPGNCYALRFAIGKNSSDKSLLDNIKLFLHPPGEFSFFIEQDTMPNVLRIDFLNLKLILSDLRTKV